VLVLGPAAGATEAPLAEPLAIGVGSEVRAVTALAAVLLTLGTMNAYYAGAAKLGAALGRDGALPGWFAAGSRAGEVPRRSLFVFSGVGALAFAVIALTGLSTRSVVLLTTGSLVLVYVLGTAAAVRLLPRRSAVRRGAGIGFVAVVVLYLTIGPYVVWSLAVGTLALGYDMWRRRRSPGRFE
jgi:amino acid efflux transporter